MNFWELVTLISAVASIVGVILPLQTRHQRLMHVCYGVVVVLASSYAAYYWNKYQRTQQVEEQANALLKDVNMNYSVQGFNQAALAFLEKNKDLFPDDYSRAQKLCEKNDCLGARYSEKSLDSTAFDYNQMSVQTSLEGMIRGIGSLETDGK